VPPRLAHRVPFVSQVREVLAGLSVPVWAGQITHRTIYSLSLEYGEGAREYDENSRRRRSLQPVERDQSVR
jgi:hypothetical protein